MHEEQEEVRQWRSRPHLGDWLNAFAIVVGGCDQQVKDEHADNGGEDNITDVARTTEIVRWWPVEIDRWTRVEGDGGRWR